MNTCVVCGDPCIRSICSTCLDDLGSIDEPVLIRFLNASAGRDKTVEKKIKPILEGDDIDDSI